MVHGGGEGQRETALSGKVAATIRPCEWQSGVLDVAKVCVMQAPPLYHTTGAVLNVISTPGLDRVARFLAFFVSAVDRAPRERINP